MPPLNWDTFADLPGSPERNFELLCRGIIRYSFGSYGVLRALANQPGVEFHLKLNQRCDALGDSGRWWGWQCKWYDLPASGALGKNRRSKIEEGIRKTENHVPGVTDWVLWTRRPLIKADQIWFAELSSSMTLHLWTGEEIENLLVGQATVLRGTYFGDLILTPGILRERHDEAVAPIRARWCPEVHQVVDAERNLRRKLGESGSWLVLRDLASDLRSQVRAAQDAPQVAAALVQKFGSVIETAMGLADGLERIADAIRDGDIDLLGDELKSQPLTLPTIVTTTPRLLRSVNHPAGLHVTNAVYACREALRLFASVAAALSSRMVAIVAPAGCGKTQLAAQLTAATDARPDGVLLHGRDLHANHSLDDLAKRVSIAAQPIPSIELLLAAMDAAGQRAHHRLPLVIDGINESEDPREWKRLLAALEPTLSRYPYVLVLFTLRPEFVDEALPEDTPRVEISDYGVDALEAIRAYFHHWKIDATDAILPGYLQHPLTLRLFCEVTNPTRQKTVGIDAMPTSLTALFDRYLVQVGERIAELAPRTQRYYANDVRRALAVIGDLLWDARTRSLEIDQLRIALGDDGRPWDQSLVRALEHEGVLLRMPSDGRGEFTPAYDRLAGHIIAASLLSNYGQEDFQIWVKEPTTATLLGGDHSERHPFADDIVYSLVGQVARRFPSKQLWQLVNNSLRVRALRYAARLEAAYLDAATVEALLDLASRGDTGLFAQLWELRGSPNHPLNAEALDRMLRATPVADRDLGWTEWLRKEQEDLSCDLERLQQNWQQRELREGDQLRALWAMWTLTSTVRQLRDRATLALYWFGRNDPDWLFKLTLDSLAVNDPYVVERMLAASYGVVMSHQEADHEFGVYLKPFVDRLTSALVGSTATAPTNHFLARLYVRGIVLFTKQFYPDLLPERVRNSWSFAVPESVSPIPSSDERADEVGQTLYMDFENYTLGRLFDDRSNYDMEHQGHQAAVAYVRGVVWSYGWRAARFEVLDREIADDAFRFGTRGRRPRAERYGKKYSWIGFYTYAGLLEDKGLFPRPNWPFSDVDIDPSFPEEPPVDGQPTVPAIWLSPSVDNHEQWIRQSATSVPPALLYRESINGHAGPWLAVHGFVSAEDRVIGREAWAFISALITPKSSTPGLVTALNDGSRPWVSRDIPSDFYTFAGEIPWHPKFAADALPAAGSEQAYQESVGANGSVVIEVLSHNYAWESYHSEMNRTGGVRVPSRSFSAHFNLRSVPQGFDQCLPDGTRASITLRGVDGLEGDILYIREDLFRGYIGDRDVIWFIFGERGLRPYPPTPPQWLIDIRQQELDAWRVVLTEADIIPRAKKTTKKTTKKTAKKATRKASSRSPKQASRD